MSLVRNKRARFAIAILLAAAAASAAANVLVVRSSGPSAATYPTGRSLTDNARIVLKNGDSLTLLSARGTRTFRGPGTFTPASPAQATSQQAQASGDRRLRIASVRQAGIVPTPSTIWQVDIDQSGNLCIADVASLELWRASSAEAAAIEITGPNGVSRRLNWPAGAATMAWPTDLGIADGAEYQIRTAGTQVPSRITFQTLASRPQELTAIAEALISNQCQVQLDLLVESAPLQ